MSTTDGHDAGQDARRRPKAPADVAPKTRGRRFWNLVTRDYDLSTPELEILVEVCRALNECDLLCETVGREGQTATGSRGQPVIHPALQELRQSRAELRRLLAELQLPDLDPDNEQTVPRGRSLQASKAAKTRWSLHGQG